MSEISITYPRHSSLDSLPMRFLRLSLEQTHAKMVLFRKRFNNVLLKLHMCGIDVTDALLEKENDKPSPSDIEVVKLLPLTIRVSERYLAVAYVQLHLFCQQHPTDTRIIGSFIIVDINGKPISDAGIAEHISTA